VWANLGILYLKHDKIKVIYSRPHRTYSKYNAFWDLFWDFNIIYLYIYYVKIYYIIYIIYFNIIYIHIPYRTKQCQTKVTKFVKVTKILFDIVLSERYA